MFTDEEKAFIYQILQTVEFKLRGDQLKKAHELYDSVQEKCNPKKKISPIQKPAV